MEQAITTLQGKAKVRRAMWSRRAQEYETKSNQVILYQLRKLFATFIVGQPVGTILFRTANVSSSTERLAREFAAIEKIDQDAAALRLEDLWMA